MDAIKGCGFEITSADEFVRLRNHEDSDLYWLAANGWASESVWLEVIERFPDMRSWVAHNKTVPLSILEFLSDDKDPRVRSEVARKRKLSHALFEKLARDPDSGVRSSIASNPKVPIGLLQLLAADPAEHVRGAVVYALLEIVGRSAAGIETPH